MHRIDIPETIVERGRRRRDGQLHVFERIDLARTAHIVVDLQVGFCQPDASMPVPTALEIVPNVNRISAALREAGGLNVFLRYTYDPGWTAWYRNLMRERLHQSMARAFTAGAPEWELIPELEVRDGDLVIDKTRFSAFIPGTCELDRELRARGIDTLIITGTVTNGCCESTARDAMQMNYNILFLSDANAAMTDADHNSTLISMTATFGDVMDTNHLLALVARSRVGSAALA